MRFRTLVHKRLAGFSLIQISIILMVAGLLAVAFLPGREAGDYNQKVAITLARMHKIDDAMRAFMVGNSRRPCPADGQYAVNNAKFGLEADNPGACTGGGGTNNVVAPLSDTTDHVVGGVVPTKTLNLPDEYAIDGWGRRFTYIVDTRATQLATCLDLQKGDSDNGLGAIAIKDASGSVKDYSMYALISHGPDGHGAFPEEGSSVSGRINSGSADADTLDNASVNANFSVNFDNKFVQKLRTSSFDDMLYYGKDFKNTCCIGSSCTLKGFRIDDIIQGDQATGPNSNFQARNDTIAVSNKLIVIGAPNAGGGRGAVYIVPMTSWGTFPPTTATGNGSAISVLAGENVGDAFGSAVVLGDITGTGKQSLIIGAPGQTSGGAASGCSGSTGNRAGGSIYIIWDIGKLPQNMIPAMAYNRGYFIRIDGSWGQKFGTSVAIGDVNGDGVKDIIVGSPDYADMSQGFANSAGATWVIISPGAPASWPGYDTANDNGAWAYPGAWSVTLLNAPFSSGSVSYPKGALIEGRDLNDGAGAGAIGLGTAVAAGDVNHSGKSAVLMTGLDGSGFDSRVYTVFGSTIMNAVNGSNHIIDLGTTSADATIINSNAYSIATGNIHAHTDGTKDIVIGATTTDHHAYVVYGAASLSGTVDATAPPTGGFNVDVGTVNNGVGLAVAAANINGDTASGIGIDDVIIGASTYNFRDFASSSHDAYVVFGGSSVSSLSVSSLNGSNGFHLAGPTLNVDPNYYKGGYYGITVAAGDTNGDGNAEVLVGAPVTNNDKTSNPASGAGSVFGVWGKSSGWNASTALGDTPCNYCP